MGRKRQRTATRYRAAVLFLALGLILPCLLPQGGLKIPAQVEKLLMETAVGESDAARLQFVCTACGLVGRVGYFWGGKSHVLGWDDRWGWPQRVRAPGSASTGWLRPYGLDCSGFVSWAAATAAGDELAYERVGEGVREQYAKCYPTAQPRPGDLAFFPDLSHVGIVLGRDREGTVWVVHCSASLGGVVVSRGEVGFTHYGTPALFAKNPVPPEAGERGGNGPFIGAEAL